MSRLHSDIRVGLVPIGAGDPGGCSGEYARAEGQFNTRPYYRRLTVPDRWLAWHEQRWVVTDTNVTADSNVSVLHMTSNAPVNVIDGRWTYYAMQYRSTGGTDLRKASPLGLCWTCLRVGSGRGGWGGVCFCLWNFSSVCKCQGRMPGTRLPVCSRGS